MPVWSSNRVAIVTAAAAILAAVALADARAHLRTGAADVQPGSQAEKPEREQIPTAQIGVSRSEIEASLGAPLSHARAGFYEHNVISSGHPAKRIYQFSEGKVVRIMDVFVPPSCAHVVANAAGCRRAANVVIFRDAVYSARSQFGEPEALPECVETEQSLTALVEGQADPLV